MSSNSNHPTLRILSASELDAVTGGALHPKPRGPCFPIPPTPPLVAM